MSQQQQKELLPTAQLQPSKVILRTYTAQSVGVVGTLPVKVVYEEQEKDLPQFIVQGKGPALSGRDWLASIKLRWPDIHRLPLSGRHESRRTIATVLRSVSSGAQNCTDPTSSPVGEGTCSAEVFPAKTSALCDQGCTGTRVGASGR